MLLEVPLAFHVTHAQQLRLELGRVGLSTISTERRLSCRRPREGDDGRKIGEGVVERGTSILDDM